jgi:hypothetical protein
MSFGLIIFFQTTKLLVVPVGFTYINNVIVGRILGMSAKPENTEEFPNRVSVEDWSRSLVNKYTSRDPELGPIHRARMQELHVVKIRRYKERKSPGHEYLVAEIAVPESGNRYLRLDRFAEDGPPAESRRANKEVFYAVSGSSQSSLALSSSLAALDDVETISGWPYDPCIDKLDCGNLSEPIIVLDLALAAELVHNDSDRYHIFRRQCFWYADTISAVLETCFPEIKIECHPPAVEGHHTENGKDEIYDENSGKFMQIPFHKRQQDVVDEIVWVFRQRKNSIIASVCFMVLYYVFCLTIAID